MGYKHSREKILDGALALAIDDGLSSLTFGRLAKRLGISDRTVVYYFPTKSDLVGETLVRVSVHLQDLLAPALPPGAAGHAEIVRAVWPIVAHPESDPYFSLYFESSGLAAAGREPYVELVPNLLSMWIDWISEFIDGTTGHRRVESATAIAVVDGLLLTRLLSGAELAEEAAQRLNFVG